MKTLLIDPEFKALIPPLAPDEFEQLRQNMEADGCRDAIVVWGETIIDGHNRYAICLRHHLDYETVEKKFSDRAEAMRWIIDHQLGRRNITLAQRVSLNLTKKTLFQEKAKANMVAGGGDKKSDQAKSGSQNFANPIPPVHTNTEVAKASGTSRENVRKVETVLNHGDDETKAAMLDGTKKIDVAFKETKAKQETKPSPTETLRRPPQRKPSTSIPIPPEREETTEALILDVERYGTVSIRILEPKLLLKSALKLAARCRELIS